MLKLCKECGVEFEATKLGQSNYCLEHSNGNTSVMRGIHCRANRKYKLTPKGLASKIRWEQSEKGKAATSRKSLRYAKTEKGRLAWMRSQAKRRSGPNYSRLKEELKINLLVCYWCHQKADVADHVIPIAMANMFGFDPDEIVAPMCTTCHRAKTGQDLADIARLKKEFVR